MEETPKSPVDFTVNSEETSKKEETTKATPPPPPAILPGVLEKIRAAAAARAAGKTPEDEPVKTPTPVVAVASAPVAKAPAVVEFKRVPSGDKELDDMEDECAAILNKHRGLEGNIPVNHPYWDLRNAIRNRMAQNNM